MFAKRNECSMQIFANIRFRMFEVQGLCILLFIEYQFLIETKDEIVLFSIEN